VTHRNPERDLGKRLKALREARGLTKYRLAKLSGVSQTYIYRIEKGEIHSPRGDTTQKLAQGLGITTAELIGDITPLATWHLVEQRLKAYVPVYDEIPEREGKEPIDYMAVTSVVSTPPTLKAYKVASLTLEPEIRSGDTVFVDTAVVPKDGDLVVAMKGAMAFLARYKVDGKKPWLEGTADTYSTKDTVIYGVVVAFGRVFGQS
jgi:transcriptional regulator with XRE-family HTH domain